MDTVIPTPAPEPNRSNLLDQIKHCIHDKHYSLRTEEAYVCWIKCFIRSSVTRLVQCVADAKTSSLSANCNYF